ncbi:MAG: thioredoxin domain-containing protein [Candidatus Pseudobacter hemicellulosilyticus]|uniref:Thioredoxin domain-containing protein n=1 Tax=Candidatus Pseudobacter hemicellulosilyticus TaxID=3121375 RepID=A0AAJ5WUN0_9BACT|nr:MAG: thioredoxin domain-containing protein [Pseudobacter sp.]
MAAHTNRLIKETSPYLLQHAHNPVDWYPWGPEALERARTESKPILVSIGYAACHWCHVMERESFEDEATAQFMNAHFVNIKIDREERPDLDHIYMDAVQAMTGSGGWPLNVFLTPAGKPFYGGTYFPPQPVYNRPSWLDVLSSISKAFHEKRTEIEAQAEQLTSHLVQSNGFGVQAAAGITDLSFPQTLPDGMFTNIMQSADKAEGGFGRAPKFPQTFTIRFLLHYYYHTKNEEALQQAELSLDKMIAGGIYDQAGGGFSRYSVDAEWLAPHFEKMLYDNALLVSVLAEAYALTGRPHYRKTIEQSLAFVERELLSPEAGFYAALDADSEGVEGKFYVWEKEEVTALLGNEAETFCRLYDVTEAGNWEHRNILRQHGSFEEVAKELGISVAALRERMDSCLEKLLRHRETRIRPGLDDKQLLSWNALMTTAYCKAYAATGIDNYQQVAVRNMDFLLAKFRSAEGDFHHTYKAGEARYPAFLDDYAALIEALIHLQEITANTAYLELARELTRLVEDRFSEPETGFFFFTPTGQPDIIVRKKEVYDGAVPSGNAQMAYNLYYLGLVFDAPAWRERALRMCKAMEQVAGRYPTSFGVWAALIQGFSRGIPEIAIVGGNFARILRDFLTQFLPLRILQAAARENDGFPLLAGKPYTDAAQLFLCREYACQKPVNEVVALMKMLSVV